MPHHRYPVLRGLAAWLLAFSLVFSGAVEQPARAAARPEASAAQPQAPASAPQAPAEAETHPLAGQVTDGSGRGLAGVTVTAVRYDNWLLLPLMQSPAGGEGAPATGAAAPGSAGQAGYAATTDEDGDYRFPALPAGTYLVRAEKAGLAFSPGARIVPLSAAEGLDFEILLQAPVIPPTTRVLSAQTNAGLAAVSPDGSRFTFSQSTAELQGLKPGDIMAGAASEAAPYGYLRKVTKVTQQGGQVIVETAPAVLEEAVGAGSLYHRAELSAADVLATNLERMEADGYRFAYRVDDLVLYDADGDEATVGDQVRANGSIEFDLEYEFYLNISQGEVANLLLVEGTRLEDRLEIRSGVDLAELEEEILLDSLDFAPVTLYIGTVPVVLVPRLVLTLGADGRVAAGMSAGVEQELALRAGAAYERPGGWQAIREAESHTSTPTARQATQAAAVTGYYAPRFSLDLYGGAGPYVQPGLYLEFETAPEAIPWWRLHGGAEAPAGYQAAGGTGAPAAGLRLGSHTVQAFEARELLAQSTNRVPYVPSSPAPSHPGAATRRPVLRWTGGDPDGDAVTYDVYLEAGDDSPDVRVAENLSETSFSPGELQFQTTYYWQVVARDAEGRSTAGPVWRFDTSRYIASALAAGDDHTCALTEAGGVWCWGYNQYGMLGDGTNTPSFTPVEVEGLSSGVVALAAGGKHTCALTETGGVWCWGYNGTGQLGDGTTYSRKTPVEVGALSSGVAALAAGIDHTCALTETGSVWCWGYNGNGQLGDGTTYSSKTPVEVGALSGGVVGLAAGGNHTCALTEAGAVWCWGNNYNGQLGDGTNTNRWIPVEVGALPGRVVGVAAGINHTCAVTEAGGVWCWGYNQYGMLGDGTTTDRWTPVEVSALSSARSGRVVEVAAGSSHTCALTETGGAWCWGVNYYGQLGDGTGGWSTTPVEVRGVSTARLSGVTVLAAGHGHNCAVTDTGDLLCWGSNFSGQLGDGTTTDRWTPVEVGALSSGVVDLVAGYYHTCALTAAGRVWCWGKNEFGQLGDGTNTDRYTPVEVSGLPGGVVALDANGSHTCALTEAGGVWCWGRNISGQLGDGTTTNRNTPVEVSALSGRVVALAVGATHTCALTETGGVWCWGDNYYGQLGNGANTDRYTPVEVSALPGGVVGVAAGFGHTCAVTEAGGVWCWGDNYYGQLGDGTTTNRNTPVEVSALPGGVVDLAAGYDHTCALTEAGGVWCWGYNYYGQLGDGTTTDRNTPVEVSALESALSSALSGRVVELVAAGYHTCALTEAGGVWCWGYNYNGELGNGLGWWKGLPAAVIGFGEEP